MLGVENNKKGFTIIEVMIVLAIAGVLMVVVFLAVPGLQRNSRNTQRTADATRFAALLFEYINTNAQVPNTCDGSSPTCFINNASYSFYSPSKIGFYKLVAANNFGPLSDNDAIRIYSFMKCNPSWNAATDPLTDGSGHMGMPTGASARTFAMFYNIETSGGFKPVCKDL